MEYKNRDRYANPDTNTKTCPDSNANANVVHRYADTCTEYNTNEYAQWQSRRSPARNLRSLTAVVRCLAIHVSRTIFDSAR